MPQSHVPPYEGIPTDEADLVSYLRKRWDLWGAELLVTECGSITVHAAVDEVLWRLHKGADLRVPAGAIAAMARRMAKARRSNAKAPSRG